MTADEPTPTTATAERVKWSSLIGTECEACGVTRDEAGLCSWCDGPDEVAAATAHFAAAVPSPETVPAEGLGEAEENRAAVERVRALHFRRPWRVTDSVLFGQTEFPDRCDHCLIGAAWPCPTIRALDGGHP